MMIMTTPKIVSALNNEEGRKFIADGEEDLGEDILHEAATSVKFEYSSRVDIVETI